MHWNQGENKTLFRNKEKTKATWMTSYLIIGISERIADDEYIRHQYFWSSFCMKYKFVIGISGRVTKNCSGSECVKLDEENSESSYSLISNKFLEVVKQTCSMKEKSFKRQPISFSNQRISKIYLHKKQIEKQNKILPGKMYWHTRNKKTYVCLYAENLWKSIWKASQKKE